MPLGDIDRPRQPVQLCVLLTVQSELAQPVWQFRLRSASGVDMNTVCFHLQWILQYMYYFALDFPHLTNKHRWRM
jgi:hypothetical protein